MQREGRYAKIPLFKAMYNKISNFIYTDIFLLSNFLRSNHLYFWLLYFLGKVKKTKVLLMWTLLKYGTKYVLVVWTWISYLWET